MSICLDVGCGVQKKSEFIGIDKVPDSDADIILDFLKEKLPYEDNSIDEIFCGDVIEHLTWKEMIILMNEIWRVLKPATSLEISTVYGIKGWTDHPTHVRPIFENQFDYFTPPYTKEKTYSQMRKADEIVAIFEVIKIEVDNGILNFKLRAIK